MKDSCGLKETVRRESVRLRERSSTVIAFTNKQKEITSDWREEMFSEHKRKCSAGDDLVDCLRNANSTVVATWLPLILYSESSFVYYII